MNLLTRLNEGIELSSISPVREMGAYEALWLEKNASFKTIADRFAADPAALPSDFVPAQTALGYANEVLSYFKKTGIRNFGIRINHAGQYPKKLRDAKNPVELLYYRGTWELTETRCIAVVGSRKPSDFGLARARKVAKDLVSSGFTVVSGLAAGIDMAAHTSAIECGGKTIAVVGTPLGTVYPKENYGLQEKIATDHLLISQVPVLRYARQAPPQNRFFFPERNITMSALTEATIIVEAGETSGTLIQARAAMYQGRKLFIMNSAFERKDLTWPARFERQGAIRVRSTNDILENL